MTYQNKEDYKQFSILLRLALERNKVSDKIQQDKIITKVISKQKRKSIKQQSYHKELSDDLVSKDKVSTHLTIKDILYSNSLAKLSHYNRYIIYLLAYYTHQDAAHILGVSRMTLYNKLKCIRV